MGIRVENMERAGQAAAWSENEEEWMVILKSRTPEEIAQILEAETDESQRLRSNFRGFHVLPDSLRRNIINFLTPPAQTQFRYAGYTQN